MCICIIILLYYIYMHMQGTYVSKYCNIKAQEINLKDSHHLYNVQFSGSPSCLQNTRTIVYN